MTPFIQPLLSDTETMSLPATAPRKAPIGTFAPARVSLHSPIGAWSMHQLPPTPTYAFVTRLPSGVANSRRRSDMFRHAKVE